MAGLLSRSTGLTFEQAMERLDPGSVDAGGGESPDEG
jgi:hypothetical protein